MNIVFVIFDTLFQISDYKLYNKSEKIQSKNIIKNEIFLKRALIIIMQI